MVFILEGLLSALDPSASGGVSLDSSSCSYYSCDHSADYVGSASNGADGKLTTDGVIYPKYTPFAHGEGVGNAPQQLWGLNVDHTGDYIGSDGSLLGDGTIYPAQEGAVAGSTTQLGSADCGYYSCDHSSDYLGSGSDGTNNLTGDGLIYPKYTPFAHAEGVGNAPQQLWGLNVDHTGDYIGSDGSLLGDGTIYPAQESAAPGTTTSLVTAADHSGAYYCTEPEANCSTEVVDPVLKPIEYPLGVKLALAAPLAAAATGVPKKGDHDMPVKPGPGHVMLMGPALLLGAAEATAKLFSSDLKSSASWMSDFKTDSCKAADAVSPVGGFLLKKGMA